jgi:class 3 adenylate cyclase
MEARLARARELIVGGHPLEAIALLRAALEEPIVDEDRAEHLLLLAAASLRLRTPSWVAEAQAALAQVEALTCDPLRRGRAALLGGTIAMIQARLEDALDLLLRATELLQEDRAELAKAFDALGTYWAAVGHATLARDYLRRSITEKEALGDTYGLAISHGQLGRLLLRLGEVEQATQALRTDLDLCGVLGDQLGGGLCKVLLGQAAARSGRWEEALELLDDAERVLPPESQTWALMLKDRALALTVAGRPEAMEVIGRARARLQALGHAYGLALLDHVEVLARGHEDPICVELLDRAIKEMGQIGTPIDQIPLLDELARCHRAQGDSDEAIRLIEMALGIAERCRADLWVDGLLKELSLADRERWSVHLIAKYRGFHSPELSYSLRSTERFAAVLFSDLVGFTAWSADRPAAEVVESLNTYFSGMADAVHEAQGYLDKYIGDGLMVVFEGDPDDGASVARACRCATLMLEKLAEFNGHRRELRKAQFQVRIGIHAGRVVVGNVGSYEKISRTAIGRVVNLAARLESASLPGRVHVSSEVRELAGDSFAFTRRDEPVVLKGLGEMHTWWLVTGADG